MNRPLAESSNKPPVTVIGVTDEGPNALSADALRHVREAEILVGGKRHLDRFSPLAPSAECLALQKNIDTVVRWVAEQDRRVVVLASGDPGFYGIGAALRRTFAADRLRVIPALTCVQMAFAAIAEPWNDAATVSAHGRSSDRSIATVLRHPKTAILTDGVNTPSTLAAAFLEAGVPDCRAVVCERLGGPQERITDTALSSLVGQEFDPLNVLLVLQESAEPQPFGLEEEELEHQNGMITKLEIRAAALARLRLQPASVIWDIGTGSGSVAMEAARLAPEGQVYAVDRSPQRLATARANARRFRRPIQFFEGEAPDACQEWPRPNAVFLGGGGAGFADLVHFALPYLLPGGRLVATIATLETLQEGITTLREAGLQPHVSQIAVSRDETVGGRLRLAALNPVFLLWTEKQAS